VHQSQDSPVPQSHFDSVNPNWSYTIDVAPVYKENPNFSYGVSFHYEPDADAWMTSCGTPEFRLLKSDVVVKLLNEAYALGLVIRAVNGFTGAVLSIFNPTIVKTSIVAPSIVVSVQA
jgi:hypothetical protein